MKVKTINIGLIDIYYCPEGIEEQASMICNSIIPNAIKNKKGRTYGDVAVLYLDKNDGDIIAEHAKISRYKNSSELIEVPHIEKLH